MISIVAVVIEAMAPAMPIRLTVQTDSDPQESAGIKDITRYTCELRRHQIKTANRPISRSTVSAPLI
ncbi:hypothetical protein Trydic_g10485 [Trypoxylus dichotomus]